VTAVHSLGMFDGACGFARTEYDCLTMDEQHDERRWAPSPGETPFEILGGEKVVRRIAHLFYEHMERAAPEVARMHRLDENGKVHPESRENFASFLVFWLGGPVEYLHTRGHPRLRMRHAPFPIDEKARDGWLLSMKLALDEVGVHGEVRDYLDQRFATVADALRNVG